MKNAYKSELDPNNKQITAMRQHVGAARWAYNWGLERIKEAAANGERWPSAVDLHREVNKLKGTEALPWWAAGRIAPWDWKNEGYRGLPWPG